MKKYSFVSIGISLLLLSGNVFAEWELLPPGWGLDGPEFWDRSKVKNNGSYFIVPFMSNNPKTGNSSYNLHKLDCMDGTETQLRWTLYSKPNMQGKIEADMRDPTHMDLPAFHDGLWTFLCKKNLMATYYKAHPSEDPRRYQPKYTPQQREAMQNMLRELERQQLLDDIDDKINRRW